MILLTNPIWGNPRMGTISASRINSFFGCGYKFKLRYIDGFFPPGGPSMYRGLGLHKAIEMDNKHFMLTDEHLSLNDLFEYAHNEFDECLKKGVFIPARDIDKTEKLINKAIDEMERSLRLYFEMEKLWFPTTVEENMQLDLGYPLPAVIRIDMIDEHDTIYDWKTMAKNTQFGMSIQDLLYSKYYEIFYGPKPRFKYVKFILTKDPKTEIQEIMPPANYDMLDRYIEAYFNAIENEVFLPASNTDYMCSEGGCPFFKMCEYQN